MSSIYNCPQCGIALSVNDPRIQQVQCSGCGYQFAIQQPPVVVGEVVHEPWQQDPITSSGLIPYKNPCALIGYYLGVFALIPCLGILLAPAALILGIFGLRARSQNPLRKGMAHAIVAIVLGGLITLGYLFLLLIPFIGQ